MASAAPEADLRGVPVNDPVVMHRKPQADAHDVDTKVGIHAAQDTEPQARTDGKAPLEVYQRPRTTTLEEAIQTALPDDQVGEDKGTSRATAAAANVPIEILQNILYLLDPDSFASAALVNRSWRNATDDAKLYAHHLSRSPLYSRQNGVITGPLDDASLRSLKRSFVQEIKRCLYTPFLRPKITIVNLISETPLSSFAAGPGGEKFDFTFSQYGRWCLAISSSRIYVVDLRGKDGMKKIPPTNSTLDGQTGVPNGSAGTIVRSAKGKEAVRDAVEQASPAAVRVTKELKVVRRPLGADILADGSVLAVLSSDHKVNLYNVKEDKVELRRTVDLDNPPYSISMSPGGEILAAAFDGGMELCSLREGALASERRTVKSHRVDKLMFSSDGSMLLGTTSTKDPATVILSAPYFNAMEHDLTQAELVNSMWTQQILFPSSSRDCSHSTLLPRFGDDNSNWTLTYDRTYESFRAVRTDDLRNGTTYFTGPQTGTDRRVQWPKDALVPSSLPSSTAKGDLVASGFKGSEIWLYGVPENLDVAVNAPSLTTQPNSPDQSSPESTAEMGNTRNQDTEVERPRWQMLMDKYRNVFSKGKKVADVPGVAAMCWYKPAQLGGAPSSHSINERLIVAAPGGVGSDFILDEETPIEGGRLVVLEFSLSPHDGTTEEITIELGKKEPLLLEEQKTDMEAEIAKVRRRTMAHRDPARVRSVIDAMRPNNDLEDIPDVPEVPGSFGFATEPTGGNTDHPDVSDDDEPGVSVEEAAAFAEGPYSHTNPRSRLALYRSATIGAASRQRFPTLSRLQQQQPQMPQPQFRRTDGTEVPDESDADNWVLPPPPYQRYMDEQLPDDLVQRALLYNGIAPIPNTFDSLVRPRRSSSVNTDNRSHRRRSSVDTDVLAHHLRPSGHDYDISRAGDTTAVSSTTVTPRSSLRRRPLTTYTSSSSVALRDSNIALRDSSIARPISHLTRTSSLSSANMRLSRSESLRRTSQAGSNLAMSPPQFNLHEQANWPLPVPREQPEPVSPPEEASDPLAEPPSEAPQASTDLSGPSLVREISNDLSQPSPASEPPVSPEEKVVHIPPPDDDEPISPRTMAPPDLPVAPWVDTPPQRDSPPAQQPMTIPPTMEAVSPEQEPEPVVTRTRSDSDAISPMTQRHPTLPLDTTPTAAQPPAQFPMMLTSPDEFRQPVSQPVQTEQTSSPPRNISRKMVQQRSPSERDNSAIAGSSSFQAQTLDNSETRNPPASLPAPAAAPRAVKDSFPEASVPEPSAFQLSNLETRPRPHARQLSGSTRRTQMTSPSPTSYTNPQTYPAYSAYAASSRNPTAELSTDASSIKSRKRRNRLSQRLRGAFRRNEPEEPMPELPIIPPMPNLVGAAQPSPTIPVQGPARHSRIYADNRNNASEPALRRPPAQRMDTIQSMGSGIGRSPSVRRQVQMPEPGAPMQMPVVHEAAPQARRPSTKRSRSIFGGRRRSQIGNTVAHNEEMPPVPPMPSSMAEAYGPGGPRSGSVPLPGTINRAATAEPLGYYPGGPAVQTEITGGRRKRGKDKDKDGKCLVM